MSAKKRVLRAGCIALVLLAFVGYFAFSTFFFSPVEGRFDADVAGLVPRDVDVYLARAELGSTFDDFPHLADGEAMAENAAVAAYLASPEWAKLDGEKRITESLAEIEEQLDQLPLGLDLFDIAGGEDVAIAADFAGRSAEDSDWAAYARLSFWGKLAVSALKQHGLLGLSKQGISVEEANGILTFSSAQLKKPIHVARIKDVVIAGVSRRLVERAIELEAEGSRDSLLLAAPYNDSILSVDRDSKQRDFELQFDLRKMREQWGMTKPWLSPNDQRFAPAFLARLLPLGAVRRLLGVVDFDQGVAVDLSGEFSSELMSAPQERVFRAKGFDHDEILEATRFAPDDSTLFVYVRGPIGTILQMVYDSLEPAAKQNLTDLLRELGYSSPQELIEILDEALVDRLAFVARPNDWGYESDMEDDPDNPGQKVYMGPVHDGSPVFAWGLIAWVSDEGELDQIRTKITGAGRRIGLEGRTPGSPGYFVKPISGGLSVKEYWSKLIPGTGHIAELIYGENLLISNRYALIDEFVTNKVGRGPGVPRLSNRGDFQILLQESEPSANLLVWLDPPSGADLLAEQAKLGVSNRLGRSIDFISKRPEVEGRVLSESFGGKSRNRLTADEAARLDELVDQELRIFRDDFLKESTPAELAKIDRQITYLRAITSALAMIQLSPKDFELSVRVVTPYER
ncbi:MAG: hypothetical protein AAF726_13655 [Planctomycetota bacterium]